MSKSLLTCLAIVGLATAMSASNIYIGNDTNGPVTIYTSAGVYIQDFGQGGATGSAVDAAGNVWTVAPNFGNNNVVEYDSSQNVLNSFIATINGQWVEDMSHGAGNTLWLGTFEGSVFAVNDQTGAILSSFAVANSSFTGVAFDGTNLWTSGGLSSNTLYYYSTSGTLLNTIAIGTVCGGVGYDASDGTLWCGGFGQMWHYDTAGNLLGGFSTTLGNYHDGVEVPNLTNGTVPEPSTLIFVGTGLAALYSRLRKRA